MNIYKTLEKLAGEKFKDNICDILVETGYDSKTVIKSFSRPQTFSEIEKYVNENRVKFTGILKGTKYENSDPFKFLPGHISLLSSLPELLTELKANKTKSSNLQVEQWNENPMQSADNSQNGEQSDHDTNTDSNDSEKFRNIKKRLIDKINKFSSKRNIDIVVSEENIKNFRLVNQVLKCSVQCPKCPKKLVPCNFARNWSCGNFQSHLKSHTVENQDIEVYEVDENNRVNKASHLNMNIVRMNNQSHLNSI